MKIEAACHCGRIRYEAEVDPQRTIICHCADCQTLSGSAFRTLAFSRVGTFRLLAGATKVYLRTGGSGMRRELHFCPECGTPICSTAVGDGPKVHAIRVGTTRQRDALAPRAQIWFRSAQPWVTKLDAIACFETDAPEGSAAGPTETM
jgi:hypothetical protein